MRNVTSFVLGAVAALAVTGTVVALAQQPVEEPAWYGTAPIRIERLASNMAASIVADVALGEYTAKQMAAVTDPKKFHMGGASKGNWEVMSTLGIFQPGDAAGPSKDYPKHWVSAEAERRYSQRFVPQRQSWHGAPQDMPTPRGIVEEYMCLQGHDLSMGNDPKGLCDDPLRDQKTVKAMADMDTCAEFIVSRNASQIASLAKVIEALPQWRTPVGSEVDRDSSAPDIHPQDLFQLRDAVVRYLLANPLVMPDPGTETSLPWWCGIPPMS